MDYSFHNSFSLMSLSDHPTTQFSLPPTMHSFTSLDNDPSHHHELIGKPAYEPSTVILFKGIPEDTTEMEILTLCRPFGIIKDILIARHKRYVFVEFGTIEQAINCYKAFTKFAPSLKGYPLYVFYTGKEKINKPDSLLGPPSRFLLLIFDKETQRIDANLVFQLLFPYGKCVRIMTFQTKPVQAFIEMEDVTQAIMAKEDLDGKNLTVLYSEEKDFFKEQGQNLEGPPPMIPFFQHQSYSMSELHVQEKQNQIEDTSDRGLARLASMEQVNKNMSILGPLLHAKEEKATNILIVKNLPKNASARLLFRLFGVCGNVMKVKIFFKNPENALVEYQDSYQASLAKFYLNNCPLNGNNIFIANSKQGVYVDTSMLKKGEETQYMGDYTASTEHRYKFAGSKNHNNIAQPSKVLHLSNLCEDKDEMYYRDLFKKYGTVKKLIFLKGGDKMALVEMENVGDAVNVLVNLHNYNINGKFLKVSFSKYSKIREFK